MPRIFSNSQRIENIKHYSDAQQWDSAILRFKKPLTYNESTVVHIKTENDDHDGTAKPFIYCKLESPILSSKMEEVAWRLPLFVFAELCVECSLAIA